MQFVFSLKGRDTIGRQLKRDADKLNFSEGRNMMKCLDRFVFHIVRCFNATLHYTSRLLKYDKTLLICTCKI